MTPGVVLKRRVSLTLLAAVVTFAAASACWADGDPTAGASVFHACAACHITNATTTKIGPGLHGLFGRKAGSVEGFPYSAAMKSCGLTWNEDTLRAYLGNPKAVVPGNRMAFGGVKDQQRLNDLIAYLKTATK